MGYRLSVIGLTPIFPIFYFPPFIFSFPPSRNFVPFAVKMPWSILRLLRLLWLIVSLRRKAKGQR